MQTFGDYAGERSGAPVRAYTRVSDESITNRNKVYEPDHLVVLDGHLLGPDVFAGLRSGGSILVNTTESADELAARCPPMTIGAIDATRISRAHKIGTRAVVVVNTTIAGAFARMQGVPLEVLPFAPGVAAAGLVRCTTTKIACREPRYRAPTERDAFHRPQHREAPLRKPAATAGKTVPLFYLPRQPASLRS